MKVSLLHKASNIFIGTSATNEVELKAHPQIVIDSKQEQRTQFLGNYNIPIPFDNSYENKIV